MNYKIIYSINYKEVSKSFFKEQLSRVTFDLLKDSQVINYVSFDFKKVLKMVKKSNKFDFDIYTNSKMRFRIYKKFKGVK